GNTKLKLAQDKVMTYSPKNTPNSAIPSQIVGLASPRRRSDASSCSPRWLAALISRIPVLRHTFPLACASIASISTPAVFMHFDPEHITANPGTPHLPLQLLRDRRTPHSSAVR